MQYRMKKTSVNKEQVTEILKREQVGNINIINQDGHPYVVPGALHLLRREDLHSRPAEGTENR